MEPSTATGANRVSDRELGLQLGALILRCFGTSSDSVIRVIDESGLSFVQMKALVALDAPEEEGTVTVSGLADSLGISAASASRAADDLVRKRLASRVEDARDRRVRRLTLTKKGRELADRIISARLAGLEDFASSLSAEERGRLESALGLLMERDDVAEIYEAHSRRARR